MGSRLRLVTRRTPEINSVSAAPVSYSSSTQVLLTLTYIEKDFEPYRPPRSITSCHPVACFSRVSACVVLSPILRKFGFSDMGTRRAMVAWIMRRVSKIVTRVSGNNRDVLPIELEIKREKRYPIPDQDSMKCVKVQKDEEDCSICLDELTESAAASMPCNHLFHGPCIAKWSKRSDSCPLCRSKIPTNR